MKHIKGIFVLGITLAMLSSSLVLADDYGSRMKSDASDASHATSDATKHAEQSTSKWGKKTAKKSKDTASSAGHKTKRAANDVKNDVNS